MEKIKKSNNTDHSKTAQAQTKCKKRHMKSIKLMKN